MSTTPPKHFQRTLQMFALIVAGEAVFALPFHVTRFFRPAVLDVFSLTATELGAAQGIYGICAMAGYFLGGPIADRVAARKLLAMSLWATAAGGLYMATFPGFKGALGLWSFFGISTILLFWAALIRATREWGGAHAQGRAYGLLDGGRGLLAAGLASLGVLLFSFAFPEGYSVASLEEKRDTLRLTIYGYTLVTASAGALAWFLIGEGQARNSMAGGPVGEGQAHNSMAGGPVGEGQAHNSMAAGPVDEGQAHKSVFSASAPGKRSLMGQYLDVLKMPAVFLQALIVLCAYVGYKGFDNYSLFAVQAYGLDEVEAARVVTIGSWMRPFAAVGAGLLGDHINASRALIFLFGLLLISDLFFALSTPITGAYWVILSNTLLTCIAIFGFRGLYFALFEEARIPLAVTGTAVGIVSFIGYTPDIFVTLVAGIMIDQSPGLAGHQQFFLFLSAFALIGLIASLLLALRLKIPAISTPN